jgi:hypothetical protein
LVIVLKRVVYMAHQAVLGPQNCCAMNKVF